MHTWSLQDAKARFSKLVNRCLSEGPQMVTRHGQQAVVMIPASEFAATNDQSLAEFLLSAPRGDLQVERPREAGREVDL